MSDHRLDVNNFTKEASEYLSSLVYQLGNVYDNLHSQDVDIEALGNALDGLIYANKRLQDQIVVLEANRKELLRNVTSEHGQENK